MYDTSRYGNMFFAAVKLWNRVILEKKVIQQMKLSNHEATNPSMRSSQYCFADWLTTAYLCPGIKNLATLNVLLQYY